LLALPRLRLDEEGQAYLKKIMLFIGLICLPNLFSFYSEFVYTFSIVGAVFSVSFFLIRFCIRDYDQFIKGYLFVVSIYIVLTFFAFFILKPYDSGFDFFIVSKMRMWADGYLIEWPNVFCVVLVIGAFLFWFRHKRLWFFLALLAALLTTSRMALVVIVLLLGYGICRKLNPVRFLLALLAVLLSIFLFLYIDDGGVVSRYITERLLKSADRILILNSLIDVYVENIFGIGNIPFSEINSTYKSYHSSFLKVLVRYGFFGLIMFLVILMPPLPLYKIVSKENVPILFLLAVGVVQDMLFHIHIVIMYSVFIGIRNKELLALKEENEK